ncbi:MAG: helix-turn-helix domain-containing protein [Bacteroidales bacterium]|nr:helix-turn-helix domain-containing protein [Bacteroidales bacterium]
MAILIFSVLPLLVCSFWLIVFVARFKKASVSQRYLTLFAVDCVVLYLCHALFFNGVSTRFTESLWVFSSLASFPLYLMYLLSITSLSVRGWRCVHVVLPALAVALMRYVIGLPWVDWVRLIVFALSIIITCVIGKKRLSHFEEELKRQYSSLENRTMRPIRPLLICLLSASLLSAVFNFIGKMTFSGDALLLAIPSTLFSVMLFWLFWIGGKYTFSMQVMVQEIQDADTPQENLTENNHQLGMVLKGLMEQQLFLRHDLKLTDLAREAGTCRTYLSSYLNNELHATFSDYINRQRVDYARQLTAENPQMGAEEVAERSGFSSLTTYKRNLAKFSQQK